MVERNEDAVSKFVEELSKTSSDNNTASPEKVVSLDRDAVLSGAKAGEVFSIKSHKPISLSEKGRIINQQIKDVERGPIEVGVSEADPVPMAPEKIVFEVSPEFEKARSEWKEARDKAHKIEEEYRQKYLEHISAQTKGVRGLLNVPRRMFGLQPRLNRELESLQEASLDARIAYKDASLKLKDAKSTKSKTFSEAEKLTSRYQKMLAHHLIVAVHKERLAKQKEGRGQAWEESKYLRPVMESLGRRKKTVGAVVLGAGILTAGILPVVAGVTAGVITRFGLGRILDKTYVESARKNLAAGKEDIGNNFFEAELSDIDDQIEHLTFDVDTRQARAKTITNTAAIAAGMSAAGYASGLGVENVSNISDIPPDTPLEITPDPTKGGFVDSRTLESLDMPNPSETASTDVNVGNESNTAETANAQSKGPITESPDSTPKGPITESGNNDIEPKMEEVTKEKGETGSTEKIVKDKNSIEVNPKAKDYSLPIGTSVNDLPSRGIVESMPQPAPVEISPQMEANLTPMTTSEATAAFGPVTGPSIESLQSDDLVTHTVGKGDNVWNILEGKGPDANPVGGKSEVLQGMSLAERHDALDKLVEYYENHPQEAIEVGAIKSEGNIHRIYPGEEINVSMLDDKLRELLGIGEAAPEPTVAPEVTLPVEEVSEIDIEPEPEVVTDQAEEVAEVSSVEVTPETTDINNMSVGDILAMYDGVESGDAVVLEELNQMGLDKASYEALNEAISKNIRQGESYDLTLPLNEWMNQYGQSAAQETVSVPPQPNSSPILDRVSYSPNDTGMVGQEAVSPLAENAEVTAAVNKYVSDVEKSSGLIFTKPSVAGTFENLKSLSIGDFKSIAANDNWPTLIQERGVSGEGFERWGDALGKQVQLIPANDTETVGDYVTRIASANIRTA